MANKIDRHWFEDQVKSYKRRREAYVEFSRVLEQVLNAAVRSLGIVAIVQARAKEVPSFAEKCIRKREKYAAPVDQFTDLCGGRVIVESKKDVQPVCGYIRSHFEVDEKNSEDVMERLKANEFGYLSVHFIVSFKEGVDYFGVRVPVEFLEGRSEAETKNSGLSPGPKFKAEVQVRTLLQHSWADLVHDGLYKSDFKPPRHLERQASRISAILEDTDNSFTRLIEDVQFYRSYYGAYMSSERIREEIEILEAVLRHDAGNAKLAHKIARLAMAAEDWGKAVEVLSGFRSASPPPAPGILRDLGVALLRQGKPEGLKHIEEAVRLDPADADGFCELGDAQTASNDPAEARRSYERAFELKPAYPRALRSFIQWKLLNGEPAVGASLRPHIEAAIRTCREWADVGVHLPWAFYDMGFFALLPGRPFESLAAFCMAVERSTTESPVEEMCGLLERIREKAGPASGALARHVDWMWKFFLAAAVAKVRGLEEAAEREVRRLEVEKRKAKKHFDDLKGRPELGGKTLEDAKKKLNEAQEAYKEALKRRESLKGKADRAPHAFLVQTEGDRTGKRFVATAREPGAPPIHPEGAPVVIVAGGCDRTVEEKVGEYRELLKFAFEGFRGTVISGGTKAGISGLAGDLPNADGQIRKIAYLPKALRESLRKDGREHGDYTVYETAGAEFSPLEPIQTWIDLLACGVKPGAVRLIGINGGEISGFEYRLGLVMGAKIGVLPDSGRAAAQIAADPDWKSHPGLILLPRDPETVRLFIQPPRALGNILEDDRQSLARAAHEKHKDERRTSLIPADPVMAEWRDLPPSLQVSNLQQVDHIEEKLRRFGLKLRRPLDRKPRIFEFESAEQVERMAEMEHARWNVERLLDGWTLGDRDHAKKTSPYLVPWKDLPGDAKEWDRQTVISLPRRLANLGYEIYDPAKEA